MKKCINNQWQKTFLIGIDDKKISTNNLKEIIFIGTSKKAIDEKNNKILLNINDGLDGKKGEKGDPTPKEYQIKDEIINANNLKKISYQGNFDYLLENDILTIKINSETCNCGEWIKVADAISGLAIFYNFKVNKNYKFTYNLGDEKNLNPISKSQFIFTCLKIPKNNDERITLFEGRNKQNGEFYPFEFDYAIPPSNARINISVKGNEGTLYELYEWKEKNEKL